MDLVTLAEQAAAAADLDGKSRDQVQWEMDFGDTEFALSIAVLDTRKPLPPAILDEIARGATRWYVNGTYRQLILNAVARQQAANAGVSTKGISPAAQAAGCQSLG